MNTPSQYVTIMVAVMGGLFSGPSLANPLLQLPLVGNPVLGTLTTQQADPHRKVLTAGPQRTVAMQPLQPSNAQFWTLVSVGPGIYRIQLFAAGSLWSLAVDPTSGQVGFERSDQTHQQLWRITSIPSIPGGLRLECFAYPGNFLAGDVNSLVSLQSWSRSPSQIWYFDDAPPPPTIVIPLQRMIQQSLVPNPPLTPVVTRLLNSNKNEILVRIANLRTGMTEDLSISSGGQQTFEFQRDSGATLTERYEVSGPAGVMLSQQFTTQVPPVVLYDVSVYEKFLQSIAIDRTGKSPNAIEDINYQPKSVGYFTIPPGERFRGGSMDIYLQAKQANNPGGVRRIDPNAFNSPAQRLDPLEETLRGIRQK